MHTSHTHTHIHFNLPSPLPRQFVKLLELYMSAEGGCVDVEVGKAMTGALKYQDITVGEVMTPIEDCFMLDVNQRLNFETIADVFKSGFSRIPIYEDTKDNVTGLLFTKDLIFIDPEDETPIRNFVQIFGRGLHVVWPDQNLGDVLRVFKKGRGHMALVRDVCDDKSGSDPYYEVKGILTLEVS